MQIYCQANNKVVLQLREITKNRMYKGNMRLLIKCKLFLLLNVLFKVGDFSACKLNAEVC